MFSPMSFQQRAPMMSAALRAPSPPPQGAFGGMRPNAPGFGSMGGGTGSFGGMQPGGMAPMGGMGAGMGGGMAMPAQNLAPPTTPPPNPQATPMNSQMQMGMPPRPMGAF